MKSYFKKLLLSTFLIIPAQVNALPHSDMEFVQKHVEDLKSVFFTFNTSVLQFANPLDRNPLSYYLQQMQVQMKRLKAITKDLKAKCSNTSTDIYRKSLQTALAVLNDIERHLIKPVYTCLVGKRTKAHLSVEDRAEMVAAGLKVRLDEFRAKTAQQLLAKLQTLHNQLTQMNFNGVATTIQQIIDIAHKEMNNRQGLTEFQKKMFKSAIRTKLKLELNK